LGRNEGGRELSKRHLSHGSLVRKGSSLFLGAIKHENNDSCATGIFWQRPQQNSAFKEHYTSTAGEQIGRRSKRRRRRKRWWFLKYPPAAAAEGGSDDRQAASKEIVGRMPARLWFARKNGQLLGPFSFSLSLSLSLPVALLWNLSFCYLLRRRRPPSSVQIYIAVLPALDFLPGLV
jgi:hypothetical protein